MSYILDALKKIEHEKIKKSSPGAAQSISGGLFNERKPPAGRFGGKKSVVILVLVVLASAATFGITWFVLKGNGTKQVAAVPTVAPSVTPPVVPLPAAPSQPQLQLQPQPQPQPQPVAPAVVVPPTASLGDDSDEEPRRRSPRRNKGGAATVPAPQSAQPTQPTQPGAQSVSPPADIKVSGIAWQDEHSARRAVVNGFLLKEGSVVAGAKITAIMTDRVRFSSPAGVFELRLDASSPGDQKR